MAGSTLVREEPILLGAFRRVLQVSPRAVMVLAPRHPERFDAVAELLEASGMLWWRRSAWTSAHPLAGAVLLLDTIGELAAVYAVASVAFVGGSLVAGGGHNIVEPARCGVPVMVGPHTENFRDIVTIFQSAEALRVVKPLELAPALLALLADPAQRRELGRRAAEVVASQSGATDRTVAALQALLQPGADSAGGPNPAARLAEPPAADPVRRA